MSHRPDLITSLQNPRIKSILSLSSSTGRREQGRLLVEGCFEIHAALGCKATLDQLIFCPELIKAEQLPLLDQLLVDHPTSFAVSLTVAKKLSFREHPDGWLGLFLPPHQAIDDFLDRVSKFKRDEVPLIVVAEGVEKPGNIGAMLRSIDAAGGHGFLSVDGRTDFGNPNLIRASKASVFGLPLAEASAKEALANLRAAGIAIVAATPSATVSFWDCDLTGPIALAVGAEQTGLSQFWLDHADQQILIPMQGSVNSLNVAQAATLILFEARRQRNL